MKLRELKLGHLFTVPSDGADVLYQLVDKTYLTVVRVASRLQDGEWSVHIHRISSYIFDNELKVQPVQIRIEPIQHKKGMELHELKPGNLFLIPGDGGDSMYQRIGLSDLTVTRIATLQLNGGQWEVHTRRLDPYMFYDEPEIQRVQIEVEPI